MQEIDRIFEKHGKDEVILTIYGMEGGGFTYSLQCRMSLIIRAIYPHQIMQSYETISKAKRSAIDMLFSWTKGSRAAKEHLRSFGIIDCPYQLEFDFS